MTQHEHLTHFASEALAVSAARQAEDWDAEYAAMDVLFAAKAQAAAAALAAERSNPNGHDAASDNAWDMVCEAGVNPDGDAGRLLYLRAYVATSAIS